MNDSSNGSPKFRIVLSGIVQESIYESSRRMKARRRGEWFSSTFRGIVEDLKRGARDVGEPLYRLRNLELTVRVVVKAGLAVTFATHDSKPLVFLKRVLITNDN